VAVLRQEGARLRYLLLTGAGPPSGWVSSKVHGKDLLVKVCTADELDSAVTVPVRPCRVQAEGVCVQCKCRIPVGGAACTSSNDETIFVHQECLHRLMCAAQTKFEVYLERLEEEEEEACQQREWVVQRTRQIEVGIQETLREAYHIGWDVRRAPRNDGPARALGCSLGPKGMCCLAVEEDPLLVRAVAVAEPSVSMNLEYLSVALRAGLS